MDSLYNWIVFLHVVGAFTFALAHGVSVAVGLRLRQERDVPRIQALLDLSNTAVQGMYLGIVVLLIGGITAAFMAGLWGRGWIWAAIAVLVLMIGFMWARASRHYGEVRRAAGLPYYILGEGKGGPGSPDTVALSRLLASGRAMELAGVGGIGLLAIVWLMVMKPF